MSLCNCLEGRWKTPALSEVKNLQRNYIAL